jgi:hypothetical protein
VSKPTAGKPVPQFDLDDPARNMFGILPCPKCQGRKRWPTGHAHKTDPQTILCDDCGHKEKIRDDDKTKS